MKLIAVTKYAELDWVRNLVEVGVSDLGESRPQQLLHRAPQLPEQITWHLIGHLQRNKVRPILPVAKVIHSVDSGRLLERIDRLAEELNSRPRVLLEVNIAAEASKDGYVPDQLVSDWEKIISFQNVELDGLMTMAPLLVFMVAV